MPKRRQRSQTSAPPPRPTEMRYVSLLPLSEMDSVACFGCFGVQVLRGCLDLFGYVARAGRDQPAPVFSIAAPLTGPAFSLRPGPAGRDSATDVDALPRRIRDDLLQLDGRSGEQPPVLAVVALYAHAPPNLAAACDISNVGRLLAGALSAKKGARPTAAVRRDSNIDDDTVSLLVSESIRSELLADIDSSVCTDNIDVHVDGLTVYPTFALLRGGLARDHGDVLPAEWTAAAHGLVSSCKQSSPPPRVVTVGAPNTGKSHCVRYLANCLLNCTPEVLVLDIDVGQSEFTAEGAVSLVSVRRPLLGAPWSHLAAAGSGVELVQSHYLGANNISLCQDRYYDAQRSLAALYFARHNHTPLLVNTHGWIAGAGLDSLELLTRLVRASHVFVNSTGSHLYDGQLIATITRAAQLDPASSRNFAVFSAAASFTPSLRPGTGAAARRVQQHVYFGHLATPVACQNKVRLPFSDLRICCLDGAVRPDDVLAAVNGAIVALVVDRTVYAGYAPQEHWPHSLARCPSPDRSHCVGLAIVHSVDVPQRCLYLVTPVPLDQLAAVNTLVQGDLAMQADRTASSIQLPPYTNSLLFSDVVGSSVRSKRRDLKRHATHH